MKRSRGSWEAAIGREKRELLQTCRCEKLPLVVLGYGLQRVTEKPRPCVALSTQQESNVRL